MERKLAWGPRLAPEEDDPEIPEPIGPVPTEPEEHRPMGSQASDIERRLFRQRAVLIFGAIDDKLAREVSARLLTLAGEADRPIDVFINSPGGHVESGDTIHDMVRYVDGSSPVRMIGTGWVASAGVLIYLAAAKERRVCLPATRFMVHQPLGGSRGPAVDIGIEAQEIVKMRERLNQQIARETGQSFEKVVKDTDRNYWMSAEEAIAYGMVSRIIKSRGDS
jgi:ATP-dependent Clp protease protease subunit